MDSSKLNLLKKRIAPISSTRGDTPTLAMTTTSPINNEIASLFECPVCFEHVLPPIMQCQNGHLLCQACRSKLNTCPTCRIHITTNIRNLQMEKLATSIWFPCKYSNLGCCEKLQYKERIEHEDDCSMRPYACPCPGLFNTRWFKF